MVVIRWREDRIRRGMAARPAAILDLTSALINGVSIARAGRLVEDQSRSGAADAVFLDIVLTINDVECTVDLDVG
jgi:hypothetical protein